MIAFIKEIAYWLWGAIFLLGCLAAAGTFYWLVGVLFCGL